MIGREETYLAGSGRYPCDLQEALNQGRKAGIRNVEMIENSQAGQLLVPRIVCVVDPDKCVACGQCQELCDCGGIGIEKSTGGLPRIVDPMLCTGGGTCAAACPYGALVLQNNSTDQKEARIGALSRQMKPDEVVAMACVWGGLPAADNAHRRKCPMTRAPTYWEFPVWARSIRLSWPKRFWKGRPVCCSSAACLKSVTIRLASTMPGTG